MSQPKRPSRQELIRQRQRSSFVGRVEQLEVFKHNLTNLQNFDGFAYPEAFLFNIWGQGGVGKSSLLRQFEDIAKQQKHLVGRIDEGITTVPEAMATFAKQLAEQGQPLPKFSERYKVYRQRREELETDPDAPQGFSAFVGKTAAKVSLRLGRKIPMGDVALDFVDEASVIDGAGEWATYVTRKLKNKDEIQLVNEPVEVLTPLFLEDLGEIAAQQIVLQFDTYERTGEILDAWLLDTLKERYGVLPSNCILTVAGREQLSANSWSGYEPVQFPLEPFSVEEATKFLQRRGVTNAEVIETILDVSGRLPLLLAILAESSPNEPTQVGEASGTAVERFLQWVDDPVKRQLALDAALPQSLNRDVVAQLVGDQDNVNALFSWLKDMPFVRERSDGWAYHDVVRPQMLRYQRRESVSHWAEKHQLLAEYYQKCSDALKLTEKHRYSDQTWQDHTLKGLYHKLCSNPQEQLTEALNGFLEVLNQNCSFARHWGELIWKAGKDLENKKIDVWGKKLVQGLRFYEQENYPEAIQTLTTTLEMPGIEQEQISVVYACRGKVYRLIDEYSKAIVDFHQALKIFPDNIWIITNCGKAYYRLKQYENALANFDRAVELNSNYETAIVSRARTYRRIAKYDDALADFNRALNLTPNDTWILTNIGITYRQMKQYDKALESFSKALEVEIDDTWAIKNRGATYAEIERYSDAIIDFNRVLTFDSEDIWAITGRGFTYYKAKQYENALSEFNRVLELNSSYEWAIGNRAKTYSRMGQYENALKDFARAIEITPNDSWIVSNRGLTYLFLKQYNRALTDFNKAIEIDANDWSYYAKALTHLALKQLKEFESSLKEAIELVRQDCQESPNDHRNIFNLALYYLVARQTEEAKHLYQNGLSKDAPVSCIKEAIEDLEDLLAIFPTFPHIAEMKSFLESALSLRQITLPVA